MYEEAKRKEEMERRKLKKKKKKKHDFKGDDYLKEHRTFKNESRRGVGPPERDRSAKRQAVVDLVEHGSSAKRRRGGEVHEKSISDFSIGMVLLGTSQCLDQTGWIHKLVSMFFFLGFHCKWEFNSCDFSFFSFLL